MLITAVASSARPTTQIKKNEFKHFVSEQPHQEKNSHSKIYDDLQMI